MIHFTIHGNLVAKQRARVVKTKHMKFPVAYTPAKTKKWEERVYAEALKVRPETLQEGELGMLCIFHFDMPQSKRRKRETWKEPYWTIGNKDLDNLIKSIKDGCQKVLYKNDNQVVVEFSTKIYVKNEEYVSIYVGNPAEILSEVIKVSERMHDIMVNKVIFQNDISVSNVTYKLEGQP